MKFLVHSIQNQIIYTQRRKTALPARQEFRYFCPLISQFFMVFTNNPFFFICPSRLLYIWIQMIMPPKHKTKQLNKIYKNLNIKNSCLFYQPYLSLHCFPILPRSCLAMSVHFWGPYFLTSSTTIWSSYNTSKWNI